MQSFFLFLIVYNYIDIFDHAILSFNVVWKKKLELRWLKYAASSKIMNYLRSFMKPAPPL